MAARPLSEAHKQEIFDAAPYCLEQGQIADRLGIPKNTLYSRVVKLGISNEVKALLGTATLSAKLSAGLSSQREYEVTHSERREPSEVRGSAFGEASGADPNEAVDVTTDEGRRHANRELQIRDLKKRNKELEAELLDQENFVERLVIASTTPLPKPSYKVRRSSSQSKDERAVLLPIFDCQYGTKVVPSDTVGGIGRFDSGVFAERAARYVEVVAKIIYAQAQNFRIGPIVFAIGGDVVEGDEIFHDQAWQLEMPSPDQVIGMRDHLSWIIDAIMEVGAEVGAKRASVLAVPGNHGRRGKKFSGRHKRDSFDVMVYRLLEERLKNYPIFTFAVEPAGNCTFDILGNLFAMIHGDQIRGWGSLPFYGLTRHDAKMMRTLNVIPQYVLLGHHHTPASIPIGYGEHFMAGNWVGATNLSGQVGSNAPQQMCFMIDAQNGVLDRIPILLDSVRRPTPTIHKTA